MSRRSIDQQWQKTWSRVILCVFYGCRSMFIDGHFEGLQTACRTKNRLLTSVYPDEVDQMGTNTRSDLKPGNNHKNNHKYGTIGRSADAVPSRYFVASRETGNGPSSHLHCGTCAAWFLWQTLGPLARRTSSSSSQMTIHSFGHWCVLVVGRDATQGSVQLSSQVELIGRDTSKSRSEMKLLS